MDNDNRELPIPDPVVHDAKAREILRVWGGSGKQHVSIATGLWNDPAAWGIMLVDLANHIENAYEESAGLKRSETLRRLKAGFDAEWQSPTDIPTGGLQG